MVLSAPRKCKNFTGLAHFTKPHAVTGRAILATSAGVKTDILLMAEALERGDMDALAAHLQTLFPSDPRAAEAREFIVGVLSSPAGVAPVGQELPFLDSAAALVGGRDALPPGVRTQSLRGPDAPIRQCDQSSRRDPIVIGEDVDFLGEGGGMAAWSIAQALNYLLLRRLRPRKCCAVVVSMRDDGVYILQWLAHYLVLGVDRIFVYTNDNQDGSEALLRLLAAHDVITLVLNGTSGRVPPHKKAFEHALHLLPELRDYEWVFFVDSDEYFMPAATFGCSIERIIAAAKKHSRHKPPSAICYNWLMLFSGSAYRWTPGLLLERFQHGIPTRYVKSLALLRDIVSMRMVHTPETLGDALFVDSSFKSVEVVNSRAPVNCSGGRMNHYWGRSFEEFAVKKARGDSLKTDHYRRDFAHFFVLHGRQQADNRWPVDPELVAAVNRKIAGLMDLPGVRATVAAVEAEYAGLIARYSVHHGLADLYEQLRRRHA
jgi:hypothetical protein